VPSVPWMVVPLDVFRMTGGLGRTEKKYYYQNSFHQNSIKIEHNIYKYTIISIVQYQRHVCNAKAVMAEEKCLLKKNKKK